MAKKKKVTEKDKAAAKQEKQPKPTVAKGQEPAAKKTTVTKSKTEEKSSADIPKAITNKKTSGTMAKKVIPAEADDKTPKAPAAMPQSDTENQKLKIAARTEKTDELNKIFSDKFAPMFSKVVKNTNASKSKKKTSIETPAASGNSSFVSMPSDKTSDDTEIPMSEVTDEASAPSALTDEPVTESPKTGGGFSLFGIEFDFSKLESDPFEELSKFFNESTREEVKEETAVEPAQPMVIVADFTLPYRCCEEYVCEDMCYTEMELAQLAIPPFAKDDFAVTRKNTKVDIYPDLNDSHLFKDMIVVKEIENEESFESHAGGIVKTDKSGEHPRFIYFPPEDKTGISDYFFYTLYNKLNGLSDMAIVWVEIAESLPSFSIDNSTLCRNAGVQTINVDPKDNDIESIAVNGSGIEMLLDNGTGKRSWTFNPKAWGVVAGINEITLFLDGEEVSRLTITINEILSDFSTEGELISIDASGVGTVAIHDQSLNLQNYYWEWRMNPNSALNTSEAVPDSNRTVFLPLPGAPSDKDFLLHVILTGKSPEGCEDIKTLDVNIRASQMEEEIKIKTVRSVEIIKKYTPIVAGFIKEIDPDVEKIIGSSTLKELDELMEADFKQVSDTNVIDEIKNGDFDVMIDKNSSNMEKVLPSATNIIPISKDEPYRNMLFTTAIITYALLAIREDDADSRDKKIAAVLNKVLSVAVSLSNVGYTPQPLLMNDFERMTKEVKDRPALNNGFNIIMSKFS
ncbi:MAG: hypothetical protein ABIQ40_17040 [Bacteroidia bacterium]